MTLSVYSHRRGRNGHKGRRQARASECLVHAPAVGEVVYPGGPQTPADEPSHKPCQQKTDNQEDESAQELREKVAEGVTGPLQDARGQAHSALPLRRPTKMLAPMAPSSLPKYRR